MNNNSNLLVSLFDFCYQIMLHEFHYGNFHFTLWNVFEVTIILCVSGTVLGKIIFMRKDN